MKRILYIVEDTKVAQFRYRVQNVVEALEKSQEYRAKWILKSEIGEAEKLLDEVDLVVILRQTAKDSVILNFIDMVHQKEKKVLFDIDDLVFDYKYLSMMMWATYAKNVIFWMGYYWGVRRIAKMVDGFITTNGFLKERIEKTFKKPCEVIRNSLNEEQVEVAKRCLGDKNTREGEGVDERKGIKKVGELEGVGNEFTIGYFSGSPTHEKDLEVAAPGILKFLAKHDEAKLEVVGYMKFHGEMKKFFEEGRIKLLPLVDYRRLEELMAEVDVNIAPLIVNEFTNCKSELKFFEAGVVETTTIASPTYTFRHAIRDGENGFLAQPGEWYEKLEYLYRNPEENRKIAKRAREDALEHYYGKEFLKEVEQVYDSFLEKEYGKI